MSLTLRLDVLIMSIETMLLTLERNLSIFLNISEKSTVPFFFLCRIEITQLLCKLVADMAGRLEGSSPQQ